MDLLIAVKELIQVIVAAALWGHQWQNSIMRCQCDNKAVVAVMATRSSEHLHLMHLLHCLFVEAHFRFELSCVHISVRRNDLPMHYCVITFLPFVEGSLRSPCPSTPDKPSAGQKHGLDLS